MLSWNGSGLSMSSAVLLCSMMPRLSALKRRTWLTEQACEPVTLYPHRSGPEAHPLGCGHLLAHRVDRHGVRLDGDRVADPRSRPGIVGTRLCAVHPHAGSTNLVGLFVHVVPNAVSPVIITTTIAVGRVILAESGLSFLGLGTEPRRLSRRFQLLKR